MFDEIKEQFSIEKTEIINGKIDKFYINKNQLKEILKMLKNSPEYSFDMLLSVCALDSGNNFEISYILHSSQINLNLVISVEVSRDNPVIDSVYEIYSSANWDEREIFDLFGIKFASHPDLKRLLLPKDWIGYPLRKDYEQNDERLCWNK